MMPESQPLTILQVTVPAVAGGLETVTVALAAGLRGCGHRSGMVAVLGASSEPHPVVGRAQLLGVECFPLPLPARTYRREIQELQSLINKFRPDVVHTHGYRADLLGGIAAARAQVPQVSTAHGFIGGGWKNRLYEWLQCRALRRAAAVVAVSDSVRRRLERAGVPPGRIRLLPNAIVVPPPLARAEARARLGIAPKERAIGWVGRVSSEKGVDVFLEALSRLPTSGWTAHIIGSGAARGAGERLAGGLGLSGRVRWHGVIQEAGRLLTAFDVFVLSSRTEGTPVVLLEAAQAEVPVIATSVGGVPDMYPGGEVDLVPAERPERLAEALARVLAAPEVAQARAERAARAMRERFAPGPWLEAHIALYAALRSRGRA